MNKLNVRQICELAFYGALIFAGKFALAGLPNIEPVTLFIALAAIVFGPAGIWSVLVYVLLEYLLYGLNIWSICYLYLWPGWFYICLAFRKENSLLFWTFACTLFGLLFGGLCALVYIPISGWDFAWKWWLGGLPFDLLHAAGNFLFCLVLFHPLKKVLVQLHKH